MHQEKIPRPTQIPHRPNPCQGASETVGYRRSIIGEGKTGFEHVFVTTDCLTK